ncbi:MAG: hypothetical protein KQJ78_23885 [Deltaproteobacteria bacterium]|nr:hypothetical protein [Deltaproteobacteria bacterium]
MAAGSKKTAIQAKCAPGSAKEYGQGREAGMAGPQAQFIEKSLQRWKLRGDGYLKH